MFNKRTFFIFAVNKKNKDMNESLYSSRIMSHGKITDLSSGFSLNGKPFSVYILKKDGSYTDLLVRCQLISDTKESDLPMATNDWTPALIVKISENALSLDDYDIYWGSPELIS